MNQREKIKRTKMIISDLAIAKICHEANKAYCQTLGDASQQAWEQAPEWQRESVIKGVEYYLANPDSKPSDSHKSWYDHKLADGWKYGLIKNHDKKEHPSMVPFEELPIEQQRKDILFLAIVRALAE